MLLGQILSFFFVWPLPSSYLPDLVFLLSWLFLCSEVCDSFQTVERLCSFSVPSTTKLGIWLVHCLWKTVTWFDDVLSVHKELTSLCIQNWTWYLHSFSSLLCSRKCTTINIDPYIRNSRKILYTTTIFLCPCSLPHQLMLILLSKYLLSPSTSLFPPLPQ